VNEFGLVICELVCNIAAVVILCMCGLTCSRAHSALPRNERYHTVDLNTDFTANDYNNIIILNYDFIANFIILNN
jgi:hypothetical protein